MISSTPLTEELEEQRERAGISENEWRDLLSVTDEMGKELDYKALTAEQFPVIVNFPKRIEDEPVMHDKDIAFDRARLDAYEWLVQRQRLASAPDADPPYVCIGSFGNHVEQVLRCSGFMRRIWRRSRDNGREARVGICYCGNEAIAKLVRRVARDLDGLRVELAMESTAGAPPGRKKPKSS